MSFKVIVLGCTGGPKENNLSGYLLSPTQTNEFIALDAGTLLSAIERAYDKGYFSDVVLDDPILAPYAVFFQREIKAYLLSHAHLDHLLGLVVNSQDDTCKPIYALDHTIDTLRDHLFNYKVWPNFGNEGHAPLSFYEYNRLKVGKKQSIGTTGYTVETFELNHSIGCSSSAFLIEYRGEYVLYFGDTGADTSHERKLIEVIWKKIAPLVASKKLKGIFLECSYTSDYQGPAQHAHLNSKSMIEALHGLQKIANCSLEGLKVIVTHRKENLKKGLDVKQMIADELTAFNNLKINFIFPCQDDKILL